MAGPGTPETTWVRFCVAPLGGFRFGDSARRLRKCAQPGCQPEAETPPGPPRGFASVGCDPGLFEEIVLNRLCGVGVKVSHGRNNAKAT